MEKISDFIFFIKEKYKIIVFGVILFIVFSLAIVLLIINRNREVKNEVVDIGDNELIINEKKSMKEEKENEIQEIKVEIKGEVKKPGVYTMDISKRVIDVINKAGGLTKSADISVINQSMKLKDEMVIIIYSKEEVLSFVKNKKIDTTKIEICKDEIKVDNNACVDTKAITNNKSSNSSTNIDIDKNNDTISEMNIKVSINTADVAELMTLPGIGESKAKSIVEYRQKEGLFNSIQDIMNVSGIGEALFEKIKDYITV